MKILLLTTLCFFVCSISGFGQICAFDQKYAQQLEIPEFKKEAEAREALIRNFVISKGNQRSNAVQAVYTIPVVVHVLHTGGAVGTIYNPSNAQIQLALNYLNAIFGGTHASSTAPFGESAVVDLGVQFQLATRSPNCGVTNGINRVNVAHLPEYSAKGINGLNTDGVDDMVIKDLVGWDPSKYYNIYVVNRIDGKDGTSGAFVGGFAEFPQASVSSADGIVLLANEFKENVKTLPHEIGHAMGLYHTFQGSNNSTQCPAAPGDYCNDTQPISNNAVNNIYDFTCRTGNNSCSAPSAPYLTYNKNTESNFMSYTNCFQLFTNDQKARVQAAMTLASRQILLTSDAFTACTPREINFLKANESVKERSTGVDDGCRNYVEYEYQMVTGAGGMIPASVILSFTGNATRGLDYEVTTNNNFSAPSDEVTFPSGSAEPQYFKIRVYDDYAVEGLENIIINFAFNGATNAVKGTSAPTMTVAIADNDLLVPYPSGSGNYTVGTVTFSVIETPLNAKKTSGKVQLIYKAAELAAGGVRQGNLTSLSLHVNNKLSSQPYKNVVIKLMNTNNDFLFTGNYYPLSGFTEVASVASFNSVLGWNEFAFSSPFNWTGGNLAVEICYNNEAASPGQTEDWWAFYEEVGAKSWALPLIFADDVSCNQNFSSFRLYNGAYKPTIKLGNTTGGTPIETALNSTSSGFVKSGSNEHFYSENGKLMAGVKSVSGASGCVDLAILESGLVWKGFSSGARSNKVFQVNYSGADPGLSYEITLYYTNEELENRTPSGFKIGKSSAPNVAGITFANTQIVTPVVTSLGAAGYAFTYTFNAFSLFFLYDQNAPLPVELSRFSAQPVENGSVLLQWNTDSEVNFDHFELESSSNPLGSFKKIATVKSNGELSSADYSYTDYTAKPGSNIYYRLKMIDRDNSFAYSRVVSAKLEEGTLISLFPNPAKSFLVVESGRGVTSTTVLSAEGREIFTREFNGETSVKLALNKLSPGIYILQMLMADGKVEARKFVLE